MTVYLVVSNRHEDVWIHGIYSTRMLAYQRVAEIEAERDECYPPYDPDGDDGYRPVPARVRPFVLDAPNDGYF